MSKSERTVQVQSKFMFESSVIRTCSLHTVTYDYLSSTYVSAWNTVF